MIARYLFLLASLFPFISFPVGVLSRGWVTPPPSGCTSLPFTDTFTRADSATLGTGYTEGPDTIQIISNAATMPAYTGSTYAAAILTASGCTPAANQEVSVIPGNIAGGGIPGVVLRATDVNNFEYVTLQSGLIALRKRVAGAETYISAFSGGTTSGHTYKVTVIGSTYTVYDNGASMGTVTDSTYSSGYAGIYMVSNTGSPPTFTSFNVQSCTTTCP